MANSSRRLFSLQTSVNVIAQPIPCLYVQPRAKSFAFNRPPDFTLDTLLVPMTFSFLGVFYSTATSLTLLTLFSPSSIALNDSLQHSELIGLANVMNTLILMGETGRTALPNPTVYNG